MTAWPQHIEDGAAPKAAVKHEVWAVAEPNQYFGDTHETLHDSLWHPTTTRLRCR